MKKLLLPVLAFLLFSCGNKKKEYDTIIRNGMIYDGNGGEPFTADIGIIKDSIAFIGDLSEASASAEIDAKGNVLSPGCIQVRNLAGTSPLAPASADNLFIYFSGGKPLYLLKQK